MPEAGRERFSFMVQRKGVACGAYLDRLARRADSPGSSPSLGLYLVLAGVAPSQVKRSITAMLYPWVFPHLNNSVYQFYLLNPPISSFKVSLLYNNQQVTGIHILIYSSMAKASSASPQILSHFSFNTRIASATITAGSNIPTLSTLNMK